MSQVNLKEKVGLTRAEMLEQMALSSRSTLNGYCNCLKIQPRI